MLWTYKGTQTFTLMGVFYGLRKCVARIRGIGAYFRNTSVLEICARTLHLNEI